MADTVAALVDALMQLRVGPLAEAVARADPDSDAAYIPPDATLGEVAGRDPGYGARMGDEVRAGTRSEEHTSYLQSLMRIPYSGYVLKKTKSTTSSTI